MKRIPALWLVLALAAAGGWFAWRMLGPPAVQVVWLDPDFSADWSGLGEEERTGVASVLQEILELDPRLTVLQEKPLKPPGQGYRTWRFSAQKHGSSLRLRLRDERGIFADAKGPPILAIQRAFSAAGFATENLYRYLPEDPAAFWELARLSGPFTWEQLATRKLQALALVDRHPGKAAPLYRAAYISLRMLLVEASSQSGALELCDGLFRRALQALPAYPRALYQYCRFRTDVGAARESLELALDFRDRFPNHPSAYGALAYAARNTGLLAGAQAALTARESLVGGLAADPGLGENTYLYLGDLERFEWSLASPPGAPPSPVRLFYRAYAKLLRGDLAGALPLFRECQSHPGRVVQFEALAQVYEFALTRRRDEALVRLRRLRDTRSFLRVPDGEFGFKLAEAFAFLGSRSEAVEAASSAFAQGFGCTRWYRYAPFLQELQSLPRWQSLLQHLQEREDVLAERFPPKVFRRN